MDKCENQRQYDVVDQMLSMHSSLRDTYSRRAFILNSSLLTCSILICAFRFADEQILAFFGLTAEAAKVGFGMLSVAILIISVIELRVKWKEVAGKHGEAVEHLSNLKAKYRRLFTETQGGDSKKNARLGRENDKVMKMLPAIPERMFNRLKAEHRFKKLLSQRINECPKAPEWFLRFQLRLEGIRDALKKGESHAAATQGKTPV